MTLKWRNLRAKFCKYKQQVHVNIKVPNISKNIVLSNEQQLKNKITCCVLIDSTPAVSLSYHNRPCDLNTEKLCQIRLASVKFQWNKVNIK